MEKPRPFTAVEGYYPEPHHTRKRAKWQFLVTITIFALLWWMYRAQETKWMGFDISPIEANEFS
jgi:hypothetical protein